MTDDGKEYVKVLSTLESCDTVRRQQLLELLDRLWWRMSADEQDQVDRYLTRLDTPAPHRRDE